jgi:hypothetical protein
MLVFWKEKLVFLAVPKTGTTALEGALAPRASLVFRDPPILKHTPIYRYQRFVHPYLEKGGETDFETFAVVRHPIDWLSSWFRYRCRDALVGHQNSTRGVSFDDFVEEYCKGKPAPFAHVGSQAKFLSFKDGQTDVTHLYRYEAQDKITDFFEQRFDMTLERKQLNVSPQFDVTLSPEIEAKYRRKRPDEFALWEQAQS